MRRFARKARRLARTTVRRTVSMAAALAWLAPGPAVQISNGEAGPPEPTGTIRGVLTSRYLRKFPAAVYIDEIEGKRFERPEVHPVMDQVNLMFEPRVMPVLVGSTVDFPNSDDVRHNVYTSKSSVCQFNLGIYPAGVTKRITCDKMGVITLLCNVHAEMIGYIVVVPTPYFATTGEAGEFLIRGVPPGTYRLTFWQVRLASQTLEVHVQAGAETTVEFTGLQRR